MFPSAEQALAFHFISGLQGIRLMGEVDGIGLGLEISKYLVEAKWDEIGAFNKPVEGSAASFTLPPSRKE